MYVVLPLRGTIFFIAKDLPKLYISITSMILPIRQCLYVLSNKSSKYYFVFFLFYMGFQLEGRGYFCQFPKNRHNEKYYVNPTRPIFGKLWSYRLVRPSWEQSQWRYLVMNNPTYTAQVKTSEHWKIISPIPCEVTNNGYWANTDITARQYVKIYLSQEWNGPN